jgi:hypothetical protein
MSFGEVCGGIIRTKSQKCDTLYSLRVMKKAEDETMKAQRAAFLFRNEKKKSAI